MADLPHLSLRARFAYAKLDKAIDALRDLVLADRHHAALDVPLFEGGEREDVGFFVFTLYRIARRYEKAEAEAALAEEKARTDESLARLLSS